MMRYLFCLLLLATPALAQEPQAPVWPDTVAPKGFKFYTKTEYAQNVSISNGLDSLILRRWTEDDVYTNAPRRLNPNRFWPIAVSGGFDDLKGWKSQGAVKFPEGQTVKVWQEHIEAGARRRLPKWSWRFPEGTVFADVLSTGGEVFEMRTATKTPDGWVFKTVYRGGTPPKGYAGAGKQCNECHDRAGAWVQYGTLWRGSDSIFSWSPFKEGSFEQKDHATE